MAYVHRVVKAGPCVEHKKMQSFRVHTKGVKRSPNTGHTTEKQERINERVAEEHLRWDKVKRTLIAESLLFYAQMGTPAAVNRIIETIFQAGHISEWWEYGGKPYHFKAYTTNPAITSDDVEEFKRVLGTVKRLSAWLDEIVLDLSTPPAEVFVGHWIHTGDFITLQRATM